ncbi:MAG: hypothetical protein PVH61_11780 [Candidatus Aminicenantes bacterium]|jgi:hypothetical protein
MIKPIIILILNLVVFCFPGFAEKVAVLPELMKPKVMAVDDTQLYVTQEASVFIYSLKDFKLVKKFGRAGQGPQEFHIVPSINLHIDVQTDQIIVVSIRKVSYFTKQGEFIKEVKMKSMAFYLQPMGDRFIGITEIAEDGVVYNTVNIYDLEINKLKEIYRVKKSFQRPGSGLKVLEKALTYQAYEDKILLPGKDDATVDVFDTEMKKLFSIHLDQKKRKVDQKFKDAVINLFKTNPTTKNYFEMLKPITFPDYFPTIRAFFVDDGTIYVMTWKMENNVNEFFTYDMSGKLKKHLMIPIQYETELQPYPITINKGKLYQIVENEEEEVWEFHMSNLN